MKTQPESPDLKRKLEEANLSETEDDIVSKKLATGWFNLLSQSRIVGKLSPLFFLPGVDIKASDSQILIPPLKCLFIKLFGMMVFFKHYFECFSATVY